MRIAVDAMGGDHGPLPIVAGALQALEDLGPSVEIALVGREEQIREALGSVSGAGGKPVRVVGASQVVDPSEPPTTALRRKKDSSIRRAAELVAAGEADGVVSAGSTGAVAATLAVVVGLVPGVDRASIGAVLPNLTGATLLIDAGANVDCRPPWLVQFAVMGRLYVELVLGHREPRVGLLSIGEEETKGNELTKAAYGLLRDAGVGFVGNVEGGDVFAGRVDVAVCDGFVGNVLLKASESIPPIAARVLAEEVGRRPFARLGMSLARPALRRAWHRLDWETYGGAPLLGVDVACIICHGRSGPKAIRNAVRVAHDFVAGQVKERIAEKLRGAA